MELLVAFRLYIRRTSHYPMESYREWTMKLRLAAIVLRPEYQGKSSSIEYCLKIYALLALVTRISITPGGVSIVAYRNSGI
jgi:hypothetical protein